MTLGGSGDGGGGGLAAEPSALSDASDGGAAALAAAAAERRLIAQATMKMYPAAAAALGGAAAAEANSRALERVGWAGAQGRAQGREGGMVGCRGRAQGLVRAGMGPRRRSSLRASIKMWSSGAPASQGRISVRLGTHPAARARSAPPQRTPLPLDSHFHACPPPWGPAACVPPYTASRDDMRSFSFQTL